MEENDYCKWPYSKEELEETINALAERGIDDDRLAECFSEAIEKAPKSVEEMEEKVAEFHKISAEGISERPDYIELAGSFIGNLVIDYLDSIADKLSLTKKEIQAIVYVLFSEEEEDW
ncbi:MAG: hypothetical protein K9M15_00365 [Candidatus Marinimicrobia bacterium]|nr:hypothetical protein [Candidatus Neomarinimicrobiota bacterium]